MEASNLKNTVILKNMPSNIIDEAIVVLKKNIKINEEEVQNYIEKERNQSNKKGNAKENSKSKDYIVKEAEMIISHYMTKLENNKRKETLNKKINQKYNKMKKCLYITSFISILEMIYIFIK